MNINFIFDFYNKDPLMATIVFAIIGIFLFFVLHIIIENKNKNKRNKYLKNKKLDNFNRINSEDSLNRLSEDEEEGPKSISQPGKPIQWVQIKKGEKDNEIKNIKELKTKNNSRSVSSTNSLNINLINDFNTNKNNLNEINQSLMSNVFANILVVDDALVIRKKLSDLLKKENYGVIIKNDGWEAFSFLNAIGQNKTQKPDLIITDIEMPNMNGIELIDAIKKIDYLKNIPIVVISSHVNLHLSLVQNGKINGFISKPFEDNDLLNQIDYLLN